jgi:CHAT domain-containing protein
MNIPLQADMVVLSACETARGRVRPGEGLIGLSWAVAIAGCPTIVSSQWKVDPASTSLQMQDFYHYLFSDHLNIRQPGTGWVTQATKAEALQRAAIKLLDPKSKYRHPHFWAGFIVLGDPR